MSSQNRKLQSGLAPANILDLKELLQRTHPKKSQELSQPRPVSQSSSLSSQPLLTQSSVFSQNFSSETLHQSSESYMGGLARNRGVKGVQLTTSSPSSQQSNAKIISMTRQLNLAQKKLQSLQKDKTRVSKEETNKVIQEIETLIQRCDAELRMQMKAEVSPEKNTVQQSNSGKKRKANISEKPDKKKRKVKAPPKGKKKKKKHPKKNVEVEESEESEETEVEDIKTPIMDAVADEEETECDSFSDDEDSKEEEDDREKTSRVKRKRETDMSGRILEKKSSRKYERIVSKEKRDTNLVVKAEMNFELLGKQITKEIRSMSDLIQTITTSEIGKLKSEIQTLSTEWREFRSSYPVYQSQFQVPKMYQQPDFSANLWHSSSMLPYQPTCLPQRPPQPSQMTYFISPRIEVQNKDAVNRRVNIEEVCLFQDEDK